MKFRLFFGTFRWVERVVMKYFERETETEEKEIMVEITTQRLLLLIKKFFGLSLVCEREELFVSLCT